MCTRCLPEPDLGTIARSFGLKMAGDTAVFCLPHDAHLQGRKLIFVESGRPYALSRFYDSPTAIGGGFYCDLCGTAPPGGVWHCPGPERKTSQGLDFCTRCIPPPSKWAAASADDSAVSGGAAAAAAAAASSVGPATIRVPQARVDYLESTLAKLRLHEVVSAHTLSLLHREAKRLGQVERLADSRLVTIIETASLLEGIDFATDSPPPDFAAIAVGKCVVCLDEAATHASTNCGHLCLCPACGGRVTSCPLCKKPIGSLVRVYLAGAA